MTLYGGRNLACVIKLKVLGWGDSPSGTDVVTEVLIRGSRNKRMYVKMEAEIGVM